MKLFTPFTRVIAAACVLSFAMAFSVEAQTVKPKPTAKKSSPTTAKKQSKLGAKTAGSKPKTSETKKKTPAKPETKPDEKAEWEKVNAVAEPAERIAAVKAFLITFPETEYAVEARSMIVTANSELGNASLLAGDPASAVLNFKMAAADAPKPVPEQLFAETLSKFPANLYFRGARTEAFEIAAILEQIAAANVTQLILIANFYMSVENGSEARRVADIAIKAAPESSAAYQTLGLASRMDFRLDASTAAYARALELDPESLSARRGLAEMKRSTGKADEAAALYREILARDENNVPAQTGLILSLFDGGKEAEAEAEMSKSLEANPGNVILLAGASYWYAAHNNGDRAVSLALTAIASDPRFIWSHIALARGYMSRKDPVMAEKTLLAARRYGNFPTLEYEIASARAAAGFYREAAEELSKSFSVKDGVIRTNLGGRVTRESTNLTELIGFERRASIFAPTAADSPENASRLTALLTFKQEIDASDPKSEIVKKAADDFIRGDDKMKVHRQIFAAEQLVEKNVALDKVMDITKSAVANVDAGLDVPNPSTAVMASELYESRRLAAARNDFVSVPEVPRQTLSTILRGQIEEIQGWALFQTDSAEDAVIRLKRAASVLPADSAWWRSSTWRLGKALAATGKDVEALDMYIRSYKGGQPNVFSYGVIEDIYKRVNGSLDGLEEQIGPKPDALGLTPVAKVVPTPAPTVTPEPTVRPTPRRTPSVVPIERATPTPLPEPTPAAVVDEPTPSPTPEEVSPTQTPEASPTPDEATPTPTPAPLPTPEETPSPTPSPIPEEATPFPTPETLPTPTEPQPTKGETPLPTPETEDPKPSETPSPSPTPDEQVPPPTVESTPVPTETAARKAFKELFDPVIISIPKPAPPPQRTPTATPKPSPTPGPETMANAGELPPRTAAKSTPDGRPRIADERPSAIPPCKLTVSEETVTLKSGGGDLAIIVGRTDDEDIEGLSATSTDPENVSLRREPITGVSTRAIYVLKAIGRPGLYQVTFQLPCGKREVAVKVR